MPGVSTLSLDSINGIVLAIERVRSKEQTEWTGKAVLALTPVRPKYPVISLDKGKQELPNRVFDQFLFPVFIEWIPWFLSISPAWRKAEIID